MNLSTMEGESIEAKMTVKRSADIDTSIDNLHPTVTNTVGIIN